jgi:lipoprotein NlpI
VSGQSFNPDLRTSPELAPKDPLTLFKKALLEQSLGRQTQAVRDFTALLSIKPDHPQVIFLMPIWE